MDKSGFINSKKITAVFAIAALVTGFFFLDRGTTGNVVLNGSLPPVDVISIVGLVLVCCSAILAFYSVRK
ncbi:MAG: hypothetical protein KJ905_02365 [Nanoarchaeota archaeon]|nr:hypothetical protein [Nanoarchaeota archaeon]MBU1501595.1 hypothetical protein [Nanoarchaeota archaeon]MBU2458987.1 hypothetical protein [Nanoarchaeota archaeon]